MSIKIIIPRSGGEESVPEGVEEALENPSINVPKHSQAKSNDLSKLENSICSSKYTLSGDDMNSNLSIDSNFFVNGKIFNNYNSNADLEKEIDIEISQEKISTPQKNQSYSKNFYVNNETNNNFSSERVICEELNNAHDKITNLSNLSNIIDDKSTKKNDVITRQMTKNEDNFVFNVIKNSERGKVKPQVLNKAFIQEEPERNTKEEQISRLNDKVNSIIKSHDYATKNSDSWYSSNSTSVRLTCFQRCRSKKV